MASYFDEYFCQNMTPSFSETAEGEKKNLSFLWYSDVERNNN